MEEKDKKDGGGTPNFLLRYANANPTGLCVCVGVCVFNVHRTHKKLLLCGRDVNLRYKNTKIL